MTLFHKTASMKLFDIHTHRNGADGEYSIYNCREYVEGRNISIGIHPWEINDRWKELFATIKNESKSKNVCAIGECGIDKLKSPANIEEQIEVFKAHALLAEEIQKPLIIHCVKGFDEIIAIYREVLPKQAWIVHGFRGKPQQAEQLIKEGFYISFGEKFNIDSLKAVPMEKLFIESDESKIDINDIYTLIAEARGCSVEKLALVVMQNVEKVSVHTI